MNRETSTGKGDNSRRIGLTVVALTLLFLVIGFLIAIYHGDMGDRSTQAKLQYVSFGNMTVSSAAGRLVLSFDLAVKPSHLSAVNNAKGLLETRFKSELSNLDPNTFYSRSGKEWLASHMRTIANKEMGDELIDAVYFGDFKIFGGKPAAATS